MIENEDESRRDIVSRVLFVFGALGLTERDLQGMNQNEHRFEYSS
jgi:hypothetical protein